MDSTNDSGFFDFVLEIPVLPAVPKDVSKVISTSANSSASNLTTFKNNDQNSENIDQNSENKEQNSNIEDQNSGNNDLNCPFCQEDQSLDSNHKCEKYQNALSQNNCSLCHLSVEEGFMKKHLEFDCKITKLFGVKKALSFQIGNSALKSEILQNSEKSKILQNSEESEMLQNSSECSNPPPLIIKEVYTLGTIHILRNQFQGRGGS